jgi:hypothetical protein
MFYVVVDTESYTYVCKQLPKLSEEPPPIGLYQSPLQRKFRCSATLFSVNLLPIAYATSGPRSLPRAWAGLHP